jgi:hypothetical protein
MAGLFAWPAWLAARAGLIDGDSEGELAANLLLASAIAISVSAAAFLARQEAAGRAVGWLATVVSVLALLSFVPLGRQAQAVSAFQILAGAAYLGAAYDGLFLGHWYLTDRKLTREPIDRYTMALIVATVIEIVAIMTGGFTGTSSSDAFNPLLTAGALAPWIAIGMAGTTLLIGLLARAALKGTRASAVQSATGFYYLAVITAITGQIAVTTRFFPA